MTALTLPTPLEGIDLGSLGPEDLLTIPLASVLKLLPNDAEPLATIQVSCWHVKHFKKERQGAGADDIIQELRNTSARDASGRPRNTKAYADGEMAANAYEIDVCANAGLANKIRNAGPKNPLHLLHPHTYGLDKAFNADAYMDAYATYILPGVAGADGGLLLFWENRKRYVRGLLNMYAVFVRGLPATFRYQTADEARDLRELTRDATDLLQCEMATTVKKMSQLGKLPDEDGDRKVVPFWLSDVLKADKESRAAHNKVTVARPDKPVEDQAGGGLPRPGTRPRPTTSAPLPTTTTTTTREGSAATCNRSAAAFHGTDGMA